jgi:hypothetical protein
LAGGERREFARGIARNQRRTYGSDQQAKSGESIRSDHGRDGTALRGAQVVYSPAP